MDGSGWRGVYDILKNDGFSVSVVQNPTISVKETHRLIRRGYTDVVDADLSKYFELDPAFGPPA